MLITQCASDKNVDLQHWILNLAGVSSEERSIIASISSPQSYGFDYLPENLQTFIEEEGGLYWSNIG